MFSTKKQHVFFEPQLPSPKFGVLQNKNELSDLYQIISIKFYEPWRGEEVQPSNIADICS